VKKRFNEEQIIGFLKEADKGVPAKELCRTAFRMRASTYGEGSTAAWTSGMQSG
jgi:putative transposase